MCLKGTVYGLLLWLPTYIQNFPSLESQSSYISGNFDYGTFVGGMIVGHVGDKFQRRAMIINPSLLISILMLFLITLLKDNAIPYYFIIFFIGIFIGGPYNNISSAMVLFLAEDERIKGNKEAVSTITSIIEGFASLSSGVV